MVFYQRPLKLAYFSPLPPQPSGISDYSQELLPHLAAVADPHLFIDDYEPSDHTIKWRYPLRNYREFAWRQAEEGFDSAVYQMATAECTATFTARCSSIPAWWYCTIWCCTT